MSTRATIASAMGAARSPHAGIVPSGRHHLDRPAGPVDAPAGQAKARGRLQCDARDDVLPGRDAAEDPTRVVAEKALRGDLVAVLGPLLLDRREPGSDLDPLDGVDPHQGGGEGGVQLGVDRLSEPARDALRAHRDPGADGVPFLAGARP